MSQPRDNGGREIPYDAFCTCSHIAAEHWVSDKQGNLFLSNCRECWASAYYILNDLVCISFKRDNLRYLEKECKKRNI